MRSTVLAPIDPVAPRIVMLRMLPAGSAAARASVDDTRSLGASPLGVMRSPYQQPARRVLETAAQHSDHAADKRRGPETVEPIHHPAVAGNEMAGIIGAEFALDPGFQQIAELRDHRQQERDTRNGAAVERA